MSVDVKCCRPLECWTGLQSSSWDRTRSVDAACRLSAPGIRSAKVCARETRSQANEARAASCTKRSVSNTVLGPVSQRFFAKS